MSAILHAATWMTLLAVAPQAPQHFKIRVIDEETGRGVPLVELRTVNQVRYFTDSAGFIALHEPAWEGMDVYFHVRSHGYEYPADSFGFHGARLKIASGGEATIKIRRINIAERLYRITGGGVYRDTVLLGIRPPTESPLLNGQVFGSDSVVNAIYRGKIYWFWGDTNRPSYPLGKLPCARGDLNSAGGGWVGSQSWRRSRLFCST